jgi:hypothetical protein
MRIAKKSGSRWLLVGTSLVLLAWSLASPIGVRAQQGDNAVWGPSTPTASAAFIDASALFNTDICVTINDILTSATYPYPSDGAVIDARGISPPPGQNYLSCSMNPFAEGQNPVPSVVLLPAATIDISYAWVLPSDTRIVGEGPNLTILEAPTSGFTGASMIQMGSDSCPASACVGVGIEHLGLNAQSNAITGILNRNSEELSYVNNVALTQMGGTGLDIEGTSNNGTPNVAVNSGPYSNIFFSGSGTCVKINGTYDTRGIRGLTCNMTGSSNAAVLVDGCNNSIEDVYITWNGAALPDGILLGSQNTAASNLLVNINGASGLTNLVHISSSNNTSGTNRCPSNAGNAGETQLTNASDVTILGATCPTCTNATVRDELTNTSLTDANVGMYAVGEPLLSITKGNNTSFYYTRFTTSPYFPTWLVGSGQPSSSCANGALYSDISTSVDSAYSLWGCDGNAWTHIK